METGYKNKQVVPEKKTKQLQEYFFPDYQVTVEASSREEAEKKVLALVEKEK